MKRRILVTGGAGELAQMIVQRKNEDYQVISPNKQELDVSCEGRVEAYFSELERLDLLICNAGVSKDVLLPNLEDQDFARVVEVNLTGAYRCIKRALPKLLKASHPHIILISSFAALHPSLGQSAYAASKAGMLGLMKSLAVELGRKDVRVNSILPGFLETKMTSGISEKIVDKIREKHALKRFNSVEVVADFVYYLDSSLLHTSGQLFQLDSRVS